QVSAIVEASKARVACFKIISDSHLISELAQRFPNARFMWIYRGYADVANSALRKFPHANQAIRLVIRGEPGGGWFQEGISPQTGEILRDFADEQLSDFDLSCLVWWARNRIAVEQNIVLLPNVRLFRYEHLVAEPMIRFAELFGFIGLDHSRRAVEGVHDHSLGRHGRAALDARVEALCEGLQQELDAIALRST
ncbi:MAG TPA: hypothetical protein VFY81_01375, partial [Gammaproteobacteria bacterium]|nr:hypothetical protein [Gammaproteobacteria bacterium]